MKIKPIPIFALLMTISSCSGTSEAEKKAAENICACMKKKETEKREYEKDKLEEDSLKNLAYSLCALDVALNRIDPYSESFTKAIERYCPDLKEIHASYLEKSK